MNIHSGRISISIDQKNEIDHDRKPIEHSGISEMSCPDIHDSNSTQSEYPEQSDSEKERKWPFLAAVASFLLPGLGQTYNGQLRKGIAFFIGTAVIFFAELFFSLFIFIDLLIIIISAYDAYITAKKMNSGELIYLKTNWRILLGFIILEIIFILSAVFYFSQFLPMNVSKGG